MKRSVRGKAVKEVPGIADDHKWRRREDFDTLHRAHEIMSDKTRMKGVKQHAKEQQETAARIARLEGKPL